MPHGANIVNAPATLLDSQADAVALTRYRRGIYANPAPLGLFAFAGTTFVYAMFVLEVGRVSVPPRLSSVWHWRMVGSGSYSRQCGNLERVTHLVRLLLLRMPLFGKCIVW